MKIFLMQFVAGSVGYLKHFTELKYLSWILRNVISCVPVTKLWYNFHVRRPLEQATLKPELHISRKDRKHMFANRFFNLSTYAFVFI